MLKIKRIALALAVIMCLGCVAYADAIPMYVSISDVGWYEYETSKSSYTDADGYDYAVVKLTAGPVYGRDYIYAYVSHADNPTVYYTETVKFSIPGTMKPTYVKKVKGDNYCLNVKLQAYSYSTTTKVEGYIAP